MATNWSIMAARAQMEQIKLEKFNLKGMKSMEVSPQLMCWYNHL